MCLIIQDPDFVMKELIIEYAFVIEGYSASENIELEVELACIILGTACDFVNDKDESVISNIYDSEKLLLGFEDKISARNVPLKLRDHYLMLVLLENKNNEYEIIMRWGNSNSKYWIINCKSSKKQVLSTSDFPFYSSVILAIYSKEVRNNDMDLVASSEFMSKKK